ncbi:MAG: hypothetical protein ACYC90_14440, partial [Candidatus Nanopelagicales bacterium]
MSCRSPESSASANTAPDWMARNTGRRRAGNGAPSRLIPTPPVVPIPGQPHLGERTEEGRLDGGRLRVQDLPGHRAMGGGEAVAGREVPGDRGRQPPPRDLDVQAPRMIGGNASTVTIGSAVLGPAAHQASGAGTNRTV